MSTNAATSSTWALRLHAALEWVWWIALLNVLWCLFALAGGIVLGVAPASVAAAESTRRRLRGESFPAVRCFAAAWRREFWRANAAVGPCFVVTALLGVSVIGQYGAGALGTPIGLASATALVISFAVTTIAVSMFAHYDLPLRAYAITALRWGLRSIPHVALLLLAAVIVAVASSILPGVIPFLSLGAWLTLSTVLCLGFFTANDRRLAEQDAAVSGPQ